MSFIIFGAGKKGKALLSQLGESRVYCFCDNHMSGSAIDSIDVISFEKLKSLSCDHKVLLSTDNDEMRKQLSDAGIKYFDCSNSFDALREALSDEFDCCEDSQVELYFVDSFELTHYLPIYEALRNSGIRAVMVAEPCAFNTAGKWFDQETTWQLLGKSGVEWYERSNNDSKVVITTQFARNVKHYRGKKIKLCYGVSILKKKAFELESEVTDPFDHVFVVGEFYRNMIIRNKSEDKVTDISYLRYKNHFKNIKDNKKILEKMGICTDKPILVYYPTWDEHSSIHDYAVEIGRLRNEYYVVVKPHHCTLRLEEKADDRKKLRDNADYFVDKNTNLSELALITDLAICDAMSGSMCEVAFLNRKVHLLAIMEPNSAGAFYIDPEQIAVTIDSPERLVEMAIRLKGDDPMKGKRNNIIGEFLSDDFEDGEKRCIDIIREFL